jgi:8-oxo-dGTP pyrophosphatase MutT (NUDIX family)
VSLPQKPLPEISDQTKSTWKPIRHDHSAGGVVFRRGPETGELEVALIATRGGKRWQLPKGSRERDESSLDTALREVEEESGLSTTCERFLLTIDYWYWDTYRREVPELVHKTVDFYLLRVTGGALNDSSYEVDAVGWFSFDRALELLAFDGEVEVVKSALALLSESADGNSGPPASA